MSTSKTWKKSWGYDKQTIWQEGFLFLLMLFGDKQKFIVGHIQRKILLMQAYKLTYSTLFFLFSFYSAPVAVKLDNNNNANPQVSTTGVFIHKGKQEKKHLSVGKK